MGRSAVVLGAAVALLIGVVVWAVPAAAYSSLSCDAHLIRADGTIDPDPVVQGATGFFIVSAAEAPAEVREGERFTVTVPSQGLTLVSSAGGFPVIAMSDFRRVFQVDGATVVAGSVTNEPPTDATASTTDDTVSLELATLAPGGSFLTFPESRFDVVAASAGTDVTVRLGGFEATLTLRSTDGSALAVRVFCTDRDPLNILARTAVLPRLLEKEDCKAGGWRLLVDSEGKRFRSQGQCVRFAGSHAGSSG